MVYNTYMYLDNYKPKNNITPHIIKDFFTKEEVDVILAIIQYQKNAKDLDEFYAPLVLPNMSRMQIEVMYPIHIQRKLEKFASELVGEEVLMFHNSYLDYTLEHNPDINPKLPVHYDSDNYFTKLTMDYQLYSNIDWPIVIEGENFNLQYGDLLLFWGAGQIHWREPVKFKNGDRTEVLTMHFSTKKDFEELNFAARDPKARKARLEEWNKDPIFAKYNKEYNEKEFNKKDQD
jgi:hypothetical protein